MLPSSTKPAFSFGSFSQFAIGADVAIIHKTSAFFGLAILFLNSEKTNEELMHVGMLSQE
jgi:hypothetical protein